MFSLRYWTKRFFPGRYWPPAGKEEVPPEPPTGAPTKTRRGRRTFKVKLRRMIEEKKRPTPPPPPPLPPLSKAKDVTNRPTLKKFDKPPVPPPAPRKLKLAGPALAKTSVVEEMAALEEQFAALAKAVAEVEALAASLKDTAQREEIEAHLDQMFEDLAKLEAPSPPTIDVKARVVKKREDDFYAEIDTMMDDFFKQRLKKFTDDIEEIMSKERRS